MKNYLFLILILFFFNCKNKIDYNNDSELCNLLVQMKEDDQKIRRMKILDTGTQIQKDSLWKIQTQKDIKNTKILIEIIKERGWFNKKDLNCDAAVPPALIFRHSPEEYFNIISKLIKTENKAGRMSTGDYVFIENHLKGRPDFSIEMNN